MTIRWRYPFPVITLLLLIFSLLALSHICPLTASDSVTLTAAVTVTAAAPTIPTQQLHSRTASDGCPDAVTYDSTPPSSSCSASTIQPHSLSSGQGQSLPSSPSSASAAATHSTAADAARVNEEFRRHDSSKLRLKQDEYQSLHAHRRRHIRNDGGGTGSGPSTSSQQSDDELAMGRLMKWALAHGASLPMTSTFSFVSSPHRAGVGLYATKPLPNPTTRLLTIPRSLFLCESVARDNPLTAGLESLGNQTNVQTWVTLHILYDYMRPVAYDGDELYDYGEDYWRPYYDVLPTRFHHLPVLFNTEPSSPEDPNVWLRGSPTLTQIRKQGDELEVEYEVHRDVCADQGFDEFFSLAQFTWARQCFATRAFGAFIPKVGVDPVEARRKKSQQVSTSFMIPVADSINHAAEATADDDSTGSADDREAQSNQPQSGPGATWKYDMVTDEFTITSIRPILKGEELTDSYGKRSNSALLRQYGFTTAYNTVKESLMSVRVQPPHEAVDWSSISADDRDDREGFYVRKLNLLKVLFGSSLFFRTLDAQEDRIPYDERDGLDVNVYRCSVDAHIDHEHQGGTFSLCHSFARIAVATPAELLDLLMPDISNLIVSRASNATHEDDGEEDASALPRIVRSCPRLSYRQPPLSWRNELAASALLSESAKLTLSGYGGSIESHRTDSTADREWIRMADENDAAGLCKDFNSSSFTSAQMLSSDHHPSPFCLTSNQRNMLVVRAEEKELLEAYVEIGNVADRFIAATKQATPLHTEDQRQLHPDHKSWSDKNWVDDAAEGKAGEGAGSQYVNEVLLPLYRRKRRESAR